MSKLRHFWVWPSRGAIRDRWNDDGPTGPGFDSFARSSRRVCELVEEWLSTRDIRARHSEVRLFLSDSGDERVRVLLWEKYLEGFDFGRVLLPDSVADLSAQARAVLVLEVAELVLTTLADLRGWENAEQLAGMADEVRRKSLRFRHVGRPKTSSDRRLRATPVAEVADDGLSRVHYEVADARSGEAQGVTRSTWVMENGQAELDHLFSRNRWVGRTGIEMTREEAHGEATWRDSTGVFEVAQLSSGPQPVNPDEPAQLGPLDEPVPASSGMDVEVVVRSDDRSDVRVIVGGSLNTAESAFDEFEGAADYLVDWVGKHGVEWWSEAEPSVLQLSLEATDYYRTGLAVRRHGDQITATSRRRAEDLFGDARDRDLARDDITALLDRTAAKLDLGPPPTLPPVDALAARTSRQVKAERGDDSWEVVQLPATRW